MTAAMWLFGIGGAALIGIGGFFVFARPAFLPEDLRYLQRTGADVDAAVPRLRRWLRLVFTVLGGYALATGTLTVYLAVTQVRHGNTSAVVVLAVAGVVSIGVMIVVNFVLRSAFRWPLLAVGAVWVTATLAPVMF
ncbi:hypothetical protein [Mycobacterium sp. OTB74]|jgi:hypothetical protein|uniref:hypothetical protein n=1 Tax=Mycobacterium sp. OTB74 TaxID=1853452 RepID=UPI002475B844|nr:hypothetical protein [Mycobacterium sp. OTB74]MDH6244044.1 hypothetical protein [Mycobacterium sp. OTB74]